MAAWKKVVIESSAGNISQKSATSGTADDITSQGALATLDTVDTAQIDASAITTAKINADAVTLAKMADNAIGLDQLYVAGDPVDGQFATADTVGGGIEWVNNPITTDSVDSDDIVAGAIDLAHMSVNSIDSDQYVDSSILSAHIASNAITNAELADASVGPASLNTQASPTNGQVIKYDDQSSGLEWMDNVVDTDTTYTMTAVENDPAAFITLTASGSGSGSVSVELSDGGGIEWSTSGSTITPSLTVPANHVTHAMYQDIATGSLIYRKTAGDGDPEVNTLATLKTDLGLTGTNSGDQTLSTRDSLGLDTDDEPTFAGLTITGEITATGGTVTLTGEVAISDEIVILNSDHASSAALDGEDVGFEVERGTNTNAKLLWNEKGGVADGSRWEVTMQDDNGDQYVVPLSVMGTSALKDDVARSIGAGAFYENNGSLYCYV